MDEIKIFVISLPLSKERQEAMSMQINSLGLQFEFIYGVNGKTLAENELAKIYDDNKAIKYLKRSMARGEIGCAQSHKLIYKKMIEENIDRAIVLEDDVQPKEDFIAIINTLRNIVIDNYIIKLDRPCTGKESKDLFYTPWRQIKLISEYKIVNPLSSVFSTCAYYIDKVAARTMLKISPKIFLTADCWDYFRRFVKLRILNKDVVDIPELFASIIDQDRKAFLKERAICYRMYSKIKNIVVGLVFGK
jgi:GR25 family glycosyltransferase involved in LPS biosynthesis